jgi:hypothetical protein
MRVYMHEHATQRPGRGATPGASARGQNRAPVRAGKRMADRLGAVGRRVRRDRPLRLPPGVIASRRRSSWPSSSAPRPSAAGQR